MLDADFPKNLMDFQDRFGDEKECIAYLCKKRWPGGFSCPKCACGYGYPLPTRRVMECASCRYQCSLTAGTMFHGTRKPLSMWFRAIFEFVSRKHGCNAMDLQRLFGLCRKVAWAWLQKIREVMVGPSRAKLAGVVEIDETHVGASEEGVHGRNRGSKKHLVVGAVEVVQSPKGKESCGRVRLGKIASGSAEHLQTWVVANVKEGATAHTDGWLGYEGMENAYVHDREVIGDPKVSCEKFPHVHRVFALIKRVISGTYQGSVSAKYLDAYCNEFVFRFNRRSAKSRTLLCQRVLENALHRAPRVHLFPGADQITLIAA